MNEYPISYQLLPWICLAIPMVYLTCAGLTLTQGRGRATALWPAASWVSGLSFAQV